MLNADEWKQVSDLFHRALDQPREIRSHFLKQSSGDNQKLIDEVLSLLASHEGAGEDFLARSPTQDLAEPPREGLRAGEKLGDFTIVKPLGSGSFGTVYLARQESLAREVALKVSADLGDEAKKLASLDHDNIVKVFSETVDAARDLRLVCMQFVPGITLEKLLGDLDETPGASLSGPAVLSAIDRHSNGGIYFRPSALDERDNFARLDDVEVILFIGARIADALSYAHARGILHLDVKPGNILLTPYGRPCLADFNVSLQRGRPDAPAPVVRGGTPRYMSPEQVAYLHGGEGSSTDPDGVDPRADVYSLGIVVREMLERVARTRHERFTPELNSVVAKSLAPAREERFRDSDEFRRVLEGCAELRKIQRRMPRTGRFLGWCERHPLVVISVCMLLPQVIGSVINISYNSIRIVSQLSPAQRAIFERLVLIYNLAVYPLCVALWIASLWPLRNYFTLRSPPGVDLPRLRRRVLALPTWMVFLTSLGWLPGAVFFPFGIAYVDGHLDHAIYVHFYISFFLSWLIALNYSFLHTQFFSVRLLYPRLWTLQTGICDTARRELKSWNARLRLFHWLSALTPLAAAMGLVALGPEQLDATQYATFRGLVTLLIGLGLSGFAWVLMGSQQISQTLYALTGSESSERV